jgi:DNA replication protein DnaC
MSHSTTPPPTTPDNLIAQLQYLKLVFVREHFEALAKEAAVNQWTHVQYLTALMEGEALARRQRSIQRRIRQARFPVVKTLEPFQWNWPRKINRLQVQNLFRLTFIEDNANVIFLGGVGLGKTHLASALGYVACQKGHSVLFATAVDVINTLAAAQNAGRLKPAFNRYIKPAVLILDELGYLPIDKTGADLLFQIISQRYEQGSIIVTSNRVFKKWPEIFNNDSTLTSALLDRLLHHAETVLIEGKSYRMKDQIEA